MAMLPRCKETTGGTTPRCKTCPAKPKKPRQIKGKRTRKRQIQTEFKAHPFEEIKEEQEG